MGWRGVLRRPRSCRRAVAGRRGGPQVARGRGRREGRSARPQSQPLLRPCRTSSAHRRGCAMSEGSVHRAAQRLTAAGGETLVEIVAEEVAVALVYNGVSHAVMMATPCDLEDFARGFSLSEHIVEKPSELFDIEVEAVGRGIEVRLEISSQRLAGLQQRRPSLAGRTGCGLCGVESLDAAL